MSDIAKMIAIAKKFGGSGSSAPSQVVILPETEVTAGTQFGIMTPLAADPAAGNVYAVTCNGTAYECEAFALPSDIGMPPDAVIMGNEETLNGELGIAGGNPDAPFMLVLWSSGWADTMGGAHGMFMPVGETESATISIVQVKGDTSAGGSASSELTVTASLDFSTATVSDADNTFAAVYAAAQAQKAVKLRLMVSGQDGQPYVVLPLTQFMQGKVVFGGVITEACWFVTWTADGITLSTI